MLVSFFFFSSSLTIFSPKFQQVQLSRQNIYAHPHILIPTYSLQLFSFPPQNPNSLIFNLSNSSLGIHESDHQPREGTSSKQDKVMLGVTNPQPRLLVSPYYHELLIQCKQKYLQCCNLIIFASCMHTIKQEQHSYQNMSCCHQTDVTNLEDNPQFLLQQQSFNMT